MKTTARLMIAVFLLAAGVAGPGGSASAQTTESGIAPVLPSASASSYYYISKPGELTMQLNIWGSIRNPGRYEVPSSTDLIQLISYSGGPTPDALLGDVRITRLLRRDSAAEAFASREQYAVDLDHLETVDPAKLVLHPGDTIFIDRSSWSSLRDVLTVVTTAAILTTAVANVIIAQQRR